MAEGINSLILPIGADPRQFDKSIKQVKDAYKNLAEQIQNTPFNLVKPEDRANLEGLSRTIKALDNDLTTIDGSSKKARTAISSLSLVAQDAPFGFIAIQNNIPNLISAFNELSSTSGGLKGALSQIGSALIGPAGIFLAFSAVTAGVTFLIKEYGSLSGAIDAFITGNGVAIKSQNDFNKALAEGGKSIGGQEAQIKILTKTLTSETSSQQQRIEAYRLAIKLSPDLVAGINEQNLSTQESINLIKAASTVQLEYLKLRAQEGGILKVLDGLKEKEFLANGKLNEAKEEEAKIKKEIADIKIKKENNLPLTTFEINQFARGNKLIKDYSEKTIEARKELTDIYVEQNKWTGSLEKSYEKIGQTISGVEDLNNKLKEQKDAADKAAKAAADYAKARDAFGMLKIELPQFDDAKSIDRKIKSLEKYGNIVLDTTKYDFERADALEQIIEIDKEYFKNIDLTKTKLESLQGTIQNYIGYLYNVREIQKELAKPINISKVSKQIDTKIFVDTNKLESDIPPIVDLLFPDKQFKDLSDAWSKINSDTEPKLEEFKNNIRDALINKELTTGVKTTYDDVEKAITDSFNKLQNSFAELSINDAINNYKTNIKSLEEVYKLTFGELVEQNKQLASSIQGFLYQPLENVFDVLLSKGEKSWKEFGDAVIATIKRIAAQLLALSIAKTIANALAPGLGSISSEALGEFLGFKANNPSFGGLEGGMQMSGQVVFVQRGSDLVGVLNRTNSTIGRIG